MAANTNMKDDISFEDASWETMSLEEILDWDWFENGTPPLAKKQKASSSFTSTRRSHSVDGTPLGLGTQHNEATSNILVDNNGSPTTGKTNSGEKTDGVDENNVDVATGKIPRELSCSASPSPMSPFSLPPGYTMHHSFMHELGVSSSKVQVTNAKASAGLNATKTVVETITKKSSSPKNRSKKRKHKSKQKVEIVLTTEMVVPTELDVLFGRGPAVNRHPGNRVFRRIKHELQEQYMAAPIQAKREISQELVDRINGRGGRFVKKEGFVWVVVSNQHAREKASQTLRTMDLSTAERSARRIYFSTEKELKENKKMMADLTQEEMEARLLFEKVQEQNSSKMSEKS